MTENKIKVTLTETDDTPNLFIWNGDILIGKIWLYPDGSISYRIFVPELTPLVQLRDSQIVIENDIKFDTPPKKKVQMRIKFELKDFDRERIWKLLFGDKPMPEQREGAVDDAFGMLNATLGDISEEEFNDILMEAKGKGPFIRKEEDEE